MADSAESDPVSPIQDRLSTPGSWDDLIDLRRWMLALYAAVLKQPPDEMIAWVGFHELSLIRNDFWLIQYSHASSEIDLPSPGFGVGGQSRCAPSKLYT